MLKQKLRILLLISFFSLSSLLRIDISFAQCSSPSAPEGSIDFLVSENSYGFCKGTTWELLSLTPGASSTCSKEKAIEFDSNTREYMICSGGVYRYVTTTSSSIPTVSVTAKGTAASKSAISNWSALSNVTVASGESLLVCISSQDTVNGVTWNGQSLTLNSSSGTAYMYSLIHPSSATGDISVSFSSTSSTGKAIAVSAANNLWKYSPGDGGENSHCHKYIS